jgi:hypothetical protein
MDIARDRNKSALSSWCTGCAERTEKIAHQSDFWRIHDVAKRAYSSNRLRIFAFDGDENIRERGNQKFRLFRPGDARMKTVSEALPGCLKRT